MRETMTSRTRRASKRVVDQGRSWWCWNCFTLDGEMARPASEAVRFAACHCDWFFEVVQLWVGTLSHGQPEMAISSNCYLLYSPPLSWHASFSSIIE